MIAGNKTPKAPARKGRSGASPLWLAIIIMLSGAALPVMILSPGCGGDSETGTGTAPEAGTTATATEVNDTESKQRYMGRISDITAYADRMNTDFEKLIGKYNDQEIEVVELIERARINEEEYREINRQLAEMEVPPDFRDPHKQLITGFFKWETFYKLEIDGLSNQDSETLNEARLMNDEAVTEVNQAISDINQG